METDNTLAIIAIVLSLLVLIGGVLMYINLPAEHEPLDISKERAEITALQNEVIQLKLDIRQLDNVDTDDIDNLSDKIRDLERDIEDCAEDARGFDDLIECLESL